jgi:hypothetical protein
MQEFKVGEYIVNVDDEAIDISPLLAEALGESAKNIVALYIFDHIQAFKQNLEKNPDLLATNLNAVPGLDADIHYITNCETVRDNESIHWCLWTQLAEQNGKQTTWKIHAITLQEAEEEYGG